MMSVISDKKIYLHVGLHKTGTSYLQKQVFPRLDPSAICYNPATIIRGFVDLRCNGFKDGDYNKLRAILQAELPKIEQDKILLSYESLSGEPWNNYADLSKITAFLKEQFPIASVLLVVRNQADWFLSLYRHSYYAGTYKTMNEFLNLSGGEFVTKTQDGSLWASQPRNVEALNFDFRKFDELYTRTFGPDSYHIFFYEDLRTDNSAFADRIAEWLGVSFSSSIGSQSENRGLSALSIRLTWLVARIFGWHRPRKTEFENIPWRSLVATRGITSLPVIALNRLSNRLRIRWAQGMQSKFDRLIYVDWDLMGNGLRQTILRHYEASNNKVIERHGHKGLKRFYDIRDT